MKLYAWFNTHACLKMGIFLKSLITYLIQVVFDSAHSMKSRRWQISINQAMMIIGSKDSPPFHNFGLIDKPKSYRRHMALKKSAIIELQNHSSRVQSRATRNVRSRKYWQRQSRFLIHHWPKFDILFGYRGVWGGLLHVPPASLVRFGYRSIPDPLAKTASRNDD